MKGWSFEGKKSFGADERKGNESTKDWKMNDVNGTSSRGMFSSVGGGEKGGPRNEKGETVDGSVAGGLMSDLSSC